jgi:ABC-type enterochelin transport system permease subunit
MTRRSPQWPKLTGSILGLEALGIFMCQARLLFWSSENSGWPDTSTTWFWLILATSLSLLAYFVYRAHNWARITVIALLILLFIHILWDSITAEIGWAHMLAESNEWEFWRQIESATLTFGVSLSMSLAPLAFVIGALCHRDVAAAFHPAITERSNQSLEPTAGRRDEQI